MVLAASIHIPARWVAWLGTLLQLVVGPLLAAVVYTAFVRARRVRLLATAVLVPGELALRIPALLRKQPLALLAALIVLALTAAMALLPSIVSSLYPAGSVFLGTSPAALLAANVSLQAMDSYGIIVSAGGVTARPQLAVRTALPNLTFAELSGATPAVLQLIPRVLFNADVGGASLAALAFASSNQPYWSSAGSSISGAASAPYGGNTYRIDSAQATPIAASIAAGPLFSLSPATMTDLSGTVPIKGISRGPVFSSLIADVWQGYCLAVPLSVSPAGGSTATNSLFLPIVIDLPTYLGSYLRTFHADSLALPNGAVVLGTRITKVTTLANDQIPSSSFQGFSSKAVCASAQTNAGPATLVFGSPVSDPNNAGHITRDVMIMNQSLANTAEFRILKIDLVVECAFTRPDATTVGVSVIANWASTGVLIGTLTVTNGMSVTNATPLTRRISYFVETSNVVPRAQQDSIWVLGASAIAVPEFISFGIPVCGAPSEVCFGLISGEMLAVLSMAFWIPFSVLLAIIVTATSIYFDTVQFMAYRHIMGHSGPYSLRSDASALNDDGLYIIQNTETRVATVGVLDTACIASKKEGQCIVTRNYISAAKQIKVLNLSPA
ncbi:hypothetical protein BASA50_002610 [Batrachochytrium salamandrivorans]|uniref:Uncharacterized protein n=1 Tax=Batrachochytrium salamandrivorans TaxID=1357716 RepID=A0ABQ8FKU7_9FUNG|nr:hypothetical protein BASA60_008873 [Batrachochytrium salamandrivorans]KAH6576975.1 hypothetical protein BASA62_001085 [Batrachochytrium salamandrivorans]KAH6581020.1 hypothetical protein BASA61_009281 [Batrachochytrium salamandrivorans]KAH6600023.1 hypothetical protein BASA50_002610 [Batrachochytrium salamandrivorans]KAH9251266.1 hypothetical protein BASA81_010888 [Batrachochytrium salamandrivorans]